ncbi:uncharacterized protein LOC127289209 [Leptopilina boulardi]|uniref:uncharacterized protein LOC127289209 n=1 Tax=Leptopilina boulardi TaxID=63433 RepID=UPI0021F55D14|nr:uncharacterized protein LOC127289209 [Leptopilina boulardi]
MERWINKVAVVTGASSGIGVALVKALVKKNINVVGLARRVENMEKIKNQLKNEKGAFYPIKCDLNKEEDIIKAFQWIEKNLKSVDILVNNAGIMTLDLLIDSSTSDLKKIIDVNVIAPTVCIREAVRIMRAHNTAGHIVNINSIAGQNVQFFNNTTFNIYSASKFAFNAVSQVVELELGHVKSPTKVTTIFPGLVKTEMPPDDLLKKIPYVDAEDISDGVIYALSTPPHVQIKELTICPVQGYEQQSIKMERWNNKVAVVTGASSGIGEALVKELVKKNVKVVGLARRIENMEKIKNHLNKNEKGAFHPIKCDVSKEQDIIKAFQWIEKNLKSVDILVNNAAVLTSDLCIESTTENLKNVIDVNLIGPTICTREAVKIMRANNTAGHIININSIAGHSVGFFNNSAFNMYSPSKFALKAMSQVVELELQHVKSPAKVTTIFPGLVKTDMPPEEAFKIIPYVDAEDICDGIIYALSTPPHVQIKELTITPVLGYQQSNKMDRWINKVAVITGASSGIGEALVKELVKKNVKVVGLARRVENMEKIKNQLKNEKGAFYPIKCDVSKEDDICNAFKWIEKNLKSVDILINNAGIIHMNLCIESSTENLKNVMDVNLIGPTICTREAVRIMRANNTAGHIININSILGQNVGFYNTHAGAMYSPSKFAFKALSQVVELELQHVKSPTKVTTIFPGLVKTEMPPDQAIKLMPYVDAEDICDAIIYALSTPPHVQIKELTITPVAGYQRK